MIPKAKLHIVFTYFGELSEVFEKCNEKSEEEKLSRHVWSICEYLMSIS
jgi:hypothetical protein